MLKKIVKKTASPEAFCFYRQNAIKLRQKLIAEAGNCLALLLLVLFADNFFILIHKFWIRLLIAIA